MTDKNRKWRRNKAKRANIELGYVPLRSSMYQSSLQRDSGYKSLAIAIIEQAIADYFILYRAGKVKELKLIDRLFEHGSGRHYRNHVQFIYLDDAINLIWFLNGGCDPLLNITLFEDEAWNIDASVIRRGILKMEREGNVFKAYNQHCKKSMEMLEDAP